MMILCLLIIMIVCLGLANFQLLKKTKEFASNPILNEQAKSLPNNMEICNEIQKMVGSKCDVVLDDKAKSSAYIFFWNRIILSNSLEDQKNYSRVMLIAHECIHSIQDKKLHRINFGLANFKNLFDIILIIFMLLGKGSYEWLMISFLISFMSFFYRMILETDAVYRSVMISSRYLSKRNMENISMQYEENVSQTIYGMYITYLLRVLVRMFLLVLLFVIMM